MAITNTTRFGLTQWSSGDDDFTREQLTTDHEIIGDNAALFLTGTSATPPTVGLENTKALYWDKTNGVLFFRGDDFGSSPASWTQVHPVVPTAHVHANLQPLDADLTALAALSTTGILVRTASDTYATRHIAVSGNGVTISNGDGIAGNTTISINAVSANTVSTIVLRDSSGNFSAGTVTAALAGNASTATAWQTSRSLTISGDASGTVSGIDGTGNIAITISLPTGNIASLRDFSDTGLMARTALNTFASRSIAVSGTGLAVSNADGIAGNPLITSNATAANTANTVVARNADGQFLIGAPTVNDHPATKSYVDTADGLKANAADVYTKSDVNGAKLYQYGNITSGGTDTSGASLPPSGTRTTPRIYVQSNDPSAATGYVGVTGDIWFQI
jgi:hypothetical protein